RALGECPHASVVEVAAAVEDAALDARALRGGGEQLADLFGLVGLRPFERLLHVLPAGRRQRPPALVVDQLRADPPIGPEDRQTRPLRRPRDLAAHTTTAPR